MQAHPLCMEDKKMIVYGHNFCMQAMMLARALKKYDVDHEWRDIMAGPPEWQSELKALARGNLSVPTVIFPDGQVMVEPYPDEVLQKMGVEQTSFLKRLQEKLAK